MKINNRKLDVVLARKCLNLSQLRAGISPQTITRIRSGIAVKPATVGKIAQALGVDPEDIIEKEE